MLTGDTGCLSGEPCVSWDLKRGKHTSRPDPPDRPSSPTYVGRDFFSYSRRRVNAICGFPFLEVGSMIAMAFHEKAGWSQVDSFFFLWDKVFSPPSRPALSPPPAAGRSPRSRGGFGATDHCRGGGQGSDLRFGQESLLVGGGMPRRGRERGSEFQPALSEGESEHRPYRDPTTSRALAIRQCRHCASRTGARLSAASAWFVQKFDPVKIGLGNMYLCDLPQQTPP